MLQGLLTFIFSFSCILLILIILIQKGKGSIGIGTLGGSNQMLFGSSGGQDIFQKITWGLGIILICGSLGLALLKSKSYQSSKYLKEYKAPVTSEAIPSNPIETTQENNKEEANKE